MSNWVFIQTLLVLLGHVIGQAHMKNPPDPDVRQHQRSKVRESLQLPETAICETGEVPAYYATLDHTLATDFGTLEYFKVSEKQCVAMCSDNQDIKGNKLLCTSMIYDTDIENCTINRNLAIPRGKADLKPRSGSIYFEKFCLPAEAPVDCGEATFFRFQQGILTGHAMKVIQTETMDECVKGCIDEEAPGCKSCMYFYNDKECIMSSESAATKPDLFLIEEKDPVVYVENGCVRANAEKAREIRKPVGSMTVESLGEKAHSDLNASAVESVQDEEKKKMQKEEIGEEPDFTQWADWSSCSGGRRVRIRSCKPGITKCTGQTVETEDCDGKAKDEKEKKEIKDMEGETDGWGSWSSCSQFQFPVNTDPCIGFQVRECRTTIEKCPGPEFRYCVLPHCQEPVESEQFEEFDRSFGAPTEFNGNREFGPRFPVFGGAQQEFQGGNQPVFNEGFNPRFNQFNPQFQPQFQPPPPPQQAQMMPMMNQFNPPPQPQQQAQMMPMMNQFNPPQPPQQGQMPMVNQFNPQQQQQPQMMPMMNQFNPQQPQMMPMMNQNMNNFGPFRRRH